MGGKEEEFEIKRAALRQIEAFMEEKYRENETKTGNWAEKENRDEEQRDRNK